MRCVGDAKRGDMLEIGGEGNCPGKVGKGKHRVEGVENGSSLQGGPELLRDLAKDRQHAADLSPLCALSFARALQGGGELFA